MKILYHHRIGSKDGQAVHLEELIGALRELGHEVMLVGPTGFSSAEFGHDPKRLAWLRRSIPKFVYELLELGYNGVSYWRLKRAWRGFRPDFIYERYNLLLLSGIWLKRRWGVPVLLEVNAPLARERMSHGGGLAFPRMAAALERWTWRNADVVLPVTGVLALEIEAGGTPADRIVIIGNAIAPARFNVSAGRAAQMRLMLGAEDRVILGFTGFVRDWHGLHSVIALLRDPELSRVQLIIVGEGPAVPELRQLAKATGVEDRVTFTGLVDRDRIAEHIAAFDIALQPKCVSYASPLKLFEYMALGKAIVAPDQPNIREVIEPSVSGILFRPDDAGSMREAIVALVKSPQLRSQLGQEAAAVIDQRKISWTENARRVTTLGERCAETAAGPRKDRGRTSAAAPP